MVHATMLLLGLQLNVPKAEKMTFSDPCKMSHSVSELLNITANIFSNKSAQNADRPVLLDPGLLRGVQDGKPRLALSSNSFWFGLFETSFKHLLKTLVEQNEKLIDPFCVQVAFDRIFVKNGNQKWMFSKITKLNNYWIFPSKIISKQPSPYLEHAVLPFQFSYVNLEPLAVAIPKNISLYLRDYSMSEFVPCNATRVKTYKDKYPKENAVKHRISDKQFSEAMTYFRYLQDFGLTPFLAGGTLLGWYRECGIIPTTSDIDFAAFPRDYTDDLLASLTQHRRYKILARLGVPAESLEIAVRLAQGGGAKVDLFFMYRDGNESYTAGLQYHNAESATEIRWYYPGHVKKLCAADLLGHLVQIPCNHELIIFTEHGDKGWAKPWPQSKFSWTSSHKNRKTRKLLSGKNATERMKWYY